MRSARTLDAEGEFVFDGRGGKEPLSGNMAFLMRFCVSLEGDRNCLWLPVQLPRDWAVGATNFPREVAGDGFGSHHRKRCRGWAFADAVIFSKNGA